MAAFPAAKRQRPSSAPRAASSLRPQRYDSSPAVSPVAMFGLHGTGLPPRQLTSSSGLLASQLEEVLHMPQQQQPHRAGVVQPSADARAIHTPPPATSASAAPALSLGLPQAAQPGNAQSFAVVHAVSVPAAARTVHFGGAPSQPQSSTFDSASEPANGAAEASPSSVPTRLPAQHAPAASPNGLAAIRQAAVEHEGYAADDPSPSSGRPLAHSHAAQEDDRPPPSVAEAAEQVYALLKQENLTKCFLIIDSPRIHFVKQFSGPS